MGLLRAKQAMEDHVVKEKGPGMRLHTGLTSSQFSSSTQAFPVEFLFWFFKFCKKATGVSMLHLNQQFFGGNDSVAVL